MKKIKVMVEWVDNNFSGGTAQVNGVVMATGKTLEGVEDSFRQAFESHIEGAKKDGDKLPGYIVVSCHRYYDA